MNTHPACDAWTMVRGVDRTSGWVPIKSADDGRIVPDAALRKCVVQSACSIELPLMKGENKREGPTYAAIELERSD